MGWMAIVSIIIEIIKIIMALRKKGESVASCTVALKEARKAGDMTKLEQILAKLRRGEDCT